MNFLNFFWNFPETHFVFRECYEQIKLKSLELNEN